MTEDRRATARSRAAPAVRARGRPRDGPRPGPRRSRRAPVHAGSLREHVPRAGRGRCGNTRGWGPPTRRTLGSAISSSTARPGSPSRSTCPRRWGTTPTTRAPGRGGQDRRGDRHGRRHAPAVRGHPARPRLDLDDDQRDRAHPVAPVRARRRGAGRRPVRALGHGAERHPQGVRGAGDVHLPAAGLDAAGHGPVRVLRRAHPALEHHLDQRVPHARGGGDRGPGGRRSRSRTASPTCRRRSTPGWSSTPSRHGCRSSSPATCTSSRRSRSSARRGACGPDHDRALRRHRPSEPDAALPRPDRRRDAHGPAAAEQRRPHRARGAVGGARGTQSLHTNSFDEALALPTEQAAKLALRTQQVLALETGVSNVADPLGGSYFVETLTAELESQPSGTWSGSRRWAVPSPRSNRASSRTRSTRAAFRLQQAVESGERAIVGVNRFEEPEERPVRIQRIDEDEVARQVERLRHVRGERDGTAVERALAEVEARHRQPAAAHARGARVPRPRWARSPTCSAASSAFTARPSDGATASRAHAHAA